MPWPGPAGCLRLFRLARPQEEEAANIAYHIAYQRYAIFGWRKKKRARTGLRGKGSWRGRQQGAGVGGRGQGAGGRGGSRGGVGAPRAGQAAGGWGVGGRGMDFDLAANKA